MPGLAELLITLLILAAILGIAWWALTSIPLPQPAKIVITVIVAIVAIGVLFTLLPGAGNLRLN